MTRRFLIYCGVLAFLAVALGTFGAHVLPGMTSQTLHDTFLTGVRYHFSHALGLGIVALTANQYGQSAWFLWSARTMATGICLFSGSLYLLVLTGQKGFAMITPIGGLGFLAAWCLFIAGIFKSEKK